MVLSQMSHIPCTLSHTSLPVRTGPAYLTLLSEVTAVLTYDPADGLILLFHEFYVNGVMKSLLFDVWLLFL